MAKKKIEEKPKEYTRRQLSHAKKQARRQQIILITGIVVIAAIILIPVIGWFVAEYMPMHKTVLDVNGVKFDMAYYIDIMKIGRISDVNNTNKTEYKDTGTLADEALQYMFQGEVMKQAAAKLGVVVSENDTRSYLKAMNYPDSKGYFGYYEIQLLLAEMQYSYFAANVTEKETQVHPLMMMLESDKQVQEMRNRIANGENFTALSEKYAQNYYSKNVNKGDFGWHVRSILKSQVGTEIPLDYAFSAKPGVLSPPITDNETYKQWGYWLIKVVDRPEEGKANVQALFVSDNVVAMDIKGKLEANTVSLGDMAEKYTQYSLSKEKKGDLGLIDKEDSTYTDTFSTYVFNPATSTGKWSDPVLETALWTRGGSWLVEVLEKEENRTVSDEDRKALITEAFNKWFEGISSDPELKYNIEMITPDMRQYAIDKVDKVYPLKQGQ